MSDIPSRLNAALEGRYRVERELGSGGMATVYLAQDLRHSRPVALKVLKPELAAVMGAERFLTEIRTTANLQHPHILALFDSGEADGFLYYVMPYVEGDTLRDLLDREKQLPVEDALRLAAAVASALDYAHRHNVVHRDIKPANILLHDGQPVVADFGIALAVQQAGGGRLTETGLSLGTPYYMSPEQATADRDPGPRSDVYSLGCVLYEMLAGEPPFQGGTAQAVLGRILTGEAPSVTEARKSVPWHVDAAIAKALERLPADRFASAADFAEALTRPEAAPPGRARRGGPSTGRSSLLPWGVAAASLVALAASLVLSGDAPTPEPPVIRSVIEVPEGQHISGAVPVLSKDGSRLAVLIQTAGETQLIQRRMDELEFRLVPGSEGARQPLLSSDGTKAVFRQAGNLTVLPLEGGPAQVLDDGGQQSASDWTEDGFIYFTQSYRGGVSRVPADGGPVETLTTPDDARRELAHWWPQVLPDGEHVLFTAFRTPIDSAELSLLSLKTGEVRVLLSGGVSGRYVSTGHILYARDNALFAAPFDPDALEVTGAPVPVVQDLGMDHANGLGSFSVSDGGTLVYFRHSEHATQVDLVWVDRAGNREPILGEPGGFSDATLSPDGGRIAFARTPPGEPPDIWVLDLIRGTESRLTSGGGSDFAPMWSADGRNIVYVAEQPVFDLFRRVADGSRPAEPLVVDGFDKYPTGFIGESVIYDWDVLPGNHAMRVPLDGSTPPDTVLACCGSLQSPTVSPNGRWLAYVSDESGRNEVYVSTYPDVSGGRRAVSSGGGQQVAWSRGGRELVYWGAEGMFSVDIDPETGEPGAPVFLFSGSYQWSDLSNRAFDVTPDGERFVMMHMPLERAPRRAIVVSNFFAELRALGR